MMKKRISVGAGLAALAILLFFWASEGNKSAGMTLAAVGFTNNASGNAEALFLVSNMSSDVSWNIYALQHKTDGGWRNVPTPMVWSSYRRSDGYVLGVPVSSTTESWRVVLYCQERRHGARGLLDRGKEVYEKHVTRKVTMRYDGRKYYVTNDFVP